MGYGLSVYNIVDSPDTTIGQYGTPVTFDSAYPLSNIATRQVSKIAKTAGNESMVTLALTNTVTGFGINPTIAIIGLSAVLNEAYEITISGSNVALGNSELFSTTETLLRPSVVTDPSRDEFTYGYFKKITCTTSAKYIVISIDAFSSIAPFELGRVWAGPSVVGTERNVSLVGGLYLGGSNATSAGGQAYGVTSKSLRQCQVTIERFSDADKQELLRALAYVGRGRPFVFMRTTSDSDTPQKAYKRDNSFYAHMEGEVSFSAQAARNLNTVSFGFVEER